MKQKTAYLFIGLAIVLTTIGAYLLGKGDTASPKTQTSLVTADWQTYDATSLGYSFQYPPDWDTLEMNESLVVGPTNAIEELRELYAKAQGFDSPYMAMQVSVRLQIELKDSFTSDENMTVVSEPTMISGVAATKYTSTYIQSLPGIDAGMQTINYVIPNGQRAIVVSLLDLRYQPLLEQIVSTFQLSKTTSGSEALMGKTKTEIQKQKGTPTDSAQNNVTKKEVWVYAAKSDDATATYIYFENNRVSQVVADEYNGSLDSNAWIR